MPCRAIECKQELAAVLNNPTGKPNWNFIAHRSGTKTDEALSGGIRNLGLEILSYRIAVHDMQTSADSYVHLKKKLKIHHLCTNEILKKKSFAEQCLVVFPIHNVRYQSI